MPPLTHCFLLAIQYILACGSDNTFNWSNVWPGAVIPYKFQATYPTFLRARVRNVFGALERATCLRFLQVTADYGGAHALIVDGALCHSMVGRRADAAGGGHQLLSLPAWCLDRPAAAVHEVLHLVGFGHEHCRLDRDKYVGVNWLLIPRKYWYTYEPRADGHALLGYRLPYDFDSCMHYGPYDFSLRRGMATLYSRHRRFPVTQNRQPSVLDVAKVNALYRCQPGHQAPCADKSRSCNWIAPADCGASPVAAALCTEACGKCDVNTTRQPFVRT